MNNETTRRKPEPVDQHVSDTGSNETLTPEMIAAMAGLLRQRITSDVIVPRPEPEQRVYGDPFKRGGKKRDKKRYKAAKMSRKQNRRKK